MTSRPHGNPEITVQYLPCRRDRESHRGEKERPPARRAAFTCSPRFDRSVTPPHPTPAAPAHVTPLTRGAVRTRRPSSGPTADAADCGAEPLTRRPTARISAPSVVACGWARRGYSPGPLATSAEMPDVTYRWVRWNYCPRENVLGQVVRSVSLL